MADVTSGILALEKPGNGEYNNNWDVPINSNSDKTDAKVTEHNTEIINARGSKASLKERLDAGTNSDGTLKAVPETEKSRNSQITGRFSDVYDRHNALDKELLWARHQEASLLAGLSYLAKGQTLNRPISGAVSGTSANFLTSSGSVFTVDGDPTPVVINCGGYIQVCRIDAATDLSGQASGTKYIYATRNSSGRVVESNADGASGGTLLNEFGSAGAQFVTKGVQPGDILVIDSGSNADQYVIESVTDESNLLIKGAFVDSVSAQSYEIKDMLHPTIAYEATKSQDGTKCYLGEAVFDGANITSILSYQYKSEWESSWTAVDVSAVTTFTLNFNHNLGVLPRDIIIYASQADDEHGAGFSAEILSISDVASDYDVGFNAGTGDASVTPSGGPYPTRSVKAQVTRNTITIQNLRDNLFYEDYTGSSQDSGYIKILVRG